MKCTACGYEGDEFYRSNRSTCKPCVRARVRANRLANHEYYKAYDRVRYYDAGYRGAPTAEAVKRGNRAWQRRNRHKRLAHSRVGHAIDKGMLVRPAACQSCCAAGPVDAHHHDYSKPLEVTWLCEPCHGQHHRKYGADASRAIVAAGRSEGKRRANRAS